MKLGDKLINKVTGRQMETVDVSLDQFMELLNRTYISQAVEKGDFDAIWKTAKGGFFSVGAKPLQSKDGSYEMRCSTGNNGFSHRNYIWIHDKAEDRYFEYHAFSFGKFRKAVKRAIADAKMQRK